MPARVVALALVVAVTSIVGSPAQADHANTRRWKANTSTSTEVVVIDRTGSAAWNAATQKAVASWNAANTTLRLRWASGTGACGYQAHTINVCLGYANGYDGYGSWRFDSTGYLSGATVSFDPERTSSYSVANRNGLACHEIGHNLVLNHSSDAGSCMATRVSVQVPNAHDYDSLRSTYGTWSGSTTTTTQPTTTTTAPQPTTTTTQPTTTTTAPQPTTTTTQPTTTTTAPQPTTTTTQPTTTTTTAPPPRKCVLVFCR